LPWNEFEGKTVLISGANGFLPAYMVETLLYLNETRHHTPTKVIGLVRNIDKAKARFAAYQNRSDLQFLVQDVCDPVKIDLPMDYIIHAASQASPKYYGIDPVGTLSANVLGTFNLLNLAKEKKVKGFLFFSSGEVYGQVPSSDKPIGETDFGVLDPAAVRSCYGESKRMGETMCVAWAHQFSIPTKMVRPVHTYGPGMSFDDGRVFADFVANVVQNQNIVMKSDGRAIRAFCYLADATKAYFTVLLRGKIGEAYNVGNANAELSVLELAEMLVKLFPEKNLQVVRQIPLVDAHGYLPSSVIHNTINMDKINQLGWIADTSPLVGFERTVRSYLKI
jgi:UDP-glucuronate decarboxylase